MYSKDPNIVGSPIVMSVFHKNLDSPFTYLKRTRDEDSQPTTRELVTTFF